MEKREKRSYLDMAGAAWDASLNKNVENPSNRKNIKQSLQIRNANRKAQSLPMPSGYRPSNSWQKS
jgi:hypothetical protein